VSRSRPQVIELFHLAFLDALRSKVDPERCVLKGGANLRYFFDSVRYSEDIDLDITGLAADWRFEENIDAVLEGDTLSRLLRANAVVIVELNKGKQTDTTRRWVIWLTASGHSERIRTKIEFSSRNGETRYKIEPVPNTVVAPYAMRPPMIQHYLLEPATEQKVYALAQRPQTQARDVFDLEILMRKGGLTAGAVPREKLETAAEAAVQLTWADFESMILPFLEPSVAVLYGEAVWYQIQDYVAGELLR
jgi:hypothetical protein